LDTPQYHFIIGVLARNGSIADMLPLEIIRVLFQKYLGI
jgi:hypothetical protein